MAVSVKYYNVELYSEIQADGADSTGRNVDQYLSHGILVFRQCSEHLKAFACRIV
jgi:hypothetical protein